jgi:hypothetical protein
MGKLAVTLAACVAALLALNVFHLVAPARAGTSVAAGNGDVNGDAEIDISDAVYLLRYLFESGAPPAACADSPAVLERLGQLESSVASLSADVEASAKDFAFVAHGGNQLRARYVVDCSGGEHLVSKTGQGFFEPLDRVVLRGGELSEDGLAIHFETDRNADLLFEFDVEDAPQGGFFSICMMLDGAEDANFLECLASDGKPVTRRNVVASVPAGLHTLQVRGALQCRSEGTNSTGATISYVAVEYLD